MSVAEVISASNSSTSAATSNRKPANLTKKTDGDDRPRVNSPAFLAYEAKKNACEARITDLRARMVIN